MLLCHYGYLPLWGLIVANVLLYPAIYLRVHDIGHGTAVNRLGWPARFLPVSNPIWGGTRVFAAVHTEHHQHLGTDRDPWLPYYTGHPLRALFFNFIEPEYSLPAVRAPARRRPRAGRTSRTTWPCSRRVGVSVDLCDPPPEPARRAQAGIFFFNFYTHRETLSAGAAIGTWERAGSCVALPVLRLLWGRERSMGSSITTAITASASSTCPCSTTKDLQDTGAYTQFHDASPIAAIKKL